VTERCFSDLGLAEPILHALTARNHVVPTPIQAQAIPDLLAGRDMLGIAQTGTGKTAAFALPILHKLSLNRGKGGPRVPRALILAPTRELAIQIGEEFRAYAANLPLRHTVIFGGVSQKQQVGALQRGVDIVVATPGRLLDLMQQRRVVLSAVEFLVLDEADRMLDMGFVRDVRKIIAALPKKRQSLLFSATMPNDVATLSGEILIDPIRVEVTPQATPVERIKQSVYHVDTSRKNALLADILSDSALAGADGVALSFCDHTERAYLRDIEKLIRQPLTVIGDAPAAPVKDSRFPAKKKHGSPSAQKRRRPRAAGGFQKRSPRGGAVAQARA
jgi:ATP-dependent RNA helicase RhlE